MIIQRKDLGSHVAIEVSARGNNRFIVRGRKVYITKINQLIDELTREELKTVFNILEDNRYIGMLNIAKTDFKAMTEDMKTVARSRFKRKLLELGVMIEYRKILFFNPFILTPMEDKNMKNSGYMTQKVWKYLNEDKDAYIDGIEDFIDHMFT